MAADCLDPDPVSGPDEVRIAVQQRDLDPTFLRRLTDEHDADGDPVRAAVLGTVEQQGKPADPVPGAGTGKPRHCVPRGWPTRSPWPTPPARRST